MKVHSVQVFLGYLYVNSELLFHLIDLGQSLGIILYVCYTIVEILCIKSDIRR